LRRAKNCRGRPALAYHRADAAASATTLNSPDAGLEIRSARWTDWPRQLPPVRAICPERVMPSLQPPGHWTLACRKLAFAALTVRA
jgi:hypothetical protein